MAEKSKTKDPAGLQFGEITEVETRMVEQSVVTAVHRYCAVTGAELKSATIADAPDGLDFETEAPAPDRRFSLVDELFGPGSLYLSTAGLSLLQSFVATARAHAEAGTLEQFAETLTVPGTR